MIYLTELCENVGLKTNIRAFLNLSIIYLLIQRPRRSSPRDITHVLARTERLNGGSDREMERNEV